MKWFNKGNVEPRQSVAEGHSMHVLPLNPQTNLPLGVFVRDTSTVVLPAVTTDGRISFLPAGSVEDFRKIEKGILDRIEKRYPKECCPGVCTYVCVGLVSTNDDRVRAAFIFEVRGFTEPIPELGDLYYSLANVRQVGDEYWTGLEKSLANEPAKSWINALIASLKQELNWTEYVDQAPKPWQDCNRNNVLDGQSK